MLDQTTGVKSRESYVFIDGVRYKKIEIEGSVFYLQFVRRGELVPELLCRRPGNWQSEKLVAGTIKTYKRVRAYFDLFRQRCFDDERGQIRYEMQFDPSIGFELPSEERDFFRKKRLFTNPIQGGPNLNFSGEW